MWQPGWEVSLGENRYRYMYGWVTLLYTWNYHNIANQSYSSINIKLLLLFLNVALPKETLVPCKESTVWQNFLDPSSNCLLFAVSIFPALSSLTVWFLYTYVLLWTAAFSISPFQPLASPGSAWCPPNTLPLKSIMFRPAPLRGIRNKEKVCPGRPLPLGVSRSSHNPHLSHEILNGGKKAPLPAGRPTEMDRKAKEA